MAIRPSRPEDGARAVEIWRAAVDATHDFLTPADRAAIEVEVRAFLPSAPLLLWVDAEGLPVAFMLVGDGHMDALFVDPAYHGRGIGRACVDHALSGWPCLTVDVNEQNPQARGFYRGMGFVETGRSATDDQGRAYPLIHMRHGG